MLTSNTDVCDDLKNGAMGTVSDVDTKANKEGMSSYVDKILVKFNNSEKAEK